MTSEVHFPSCSLDMSSYRTRDFGLSSPYPFATILGTTTEERATTY